MKRLFLMACMVLTIASFTAGCGGKDKEQTEPSVSKSIQESSETEASAEKSPEESAPVSSAGNLEQELAELDKYITFDTKTMDGEAIASTVFADHKLTMMYFCGTYAFPKQDELSVLQDVYASIKDNPDLNLMVGFIDTPSTPTEDTEAVAKEALTKAGAEYKSIIMDATLANWVVAHLKGVPTTYFVDTNGKIAGTPIQGMQSAEKYLEKLNEAFQALPAAE